MRSRWAAGLSLVVATALVGCATTRKEQQIVSEHVTVGAITGTIVFPVVGTALGTGIGWVMGKQLVALDRTKRATELKDELEKQAALRAKIRSLKASHLLQGEEGPRTGKESAPAIAAGITGTSPLMWVERRAEERFRPAVEEGWISVLPTAESLNIYLNDTLFFGDQETLSSKGQRVLRLLEPLFQAVPPDSQISLEDAHPNDREENLSQIPGHPSSRVKLGNLASYLTEEMELPFPLTVKEPFPSLDPLENGSVIRLLLVSDSAS